MSFSFEMKTAVGIPGPMKSLRVEAEYRWHGNTEGFVTGMTGRLLLEENMIGSLVEVDPSNQRFNNGRPFVYDKRDRIKFLLTIPDVSMKAIESYRARNEGDVRLRLSMDVQWIEAIQDESKGASYDKHWFTGMPHWESESLSIVIPQSEWIKRLREMRWEERRIFEIPILPPVGENCEYKRAVELLEEAQGQYRIGKYKECLFNCRSALESMAKHENKKPNEGFAALFTRAFPEGDGKKAGAINQFVLEFSKFLHLARHEDSPHTMFEREETEFGLITTLALFDAVGKRILSNQKLKS